MTPFEMVRIGCYVLAAPICLYLALYSLRVRDWWLMLLYGSLSALMVWYMAEITIASTGVNTRELRVIGTPMVVGLTVALGGIVFRVHQGRSDGG